MSKVVEVSGRRSALRPKNQLLYSSVVSQNISLNRKENKRKNSFNNGYDKNAHQSQLLNKVNSDFRPYEILMSRANSSDVSYNYNTIKSQIQPHNDIVDSDSSSPQPKRKIINQKNSNKLTLKEQLHREVDKDFVVDSSPDELSFNCNKHHLLQLINDLDPDILVLSVTFLKPHFNCTLKGFYSLRDDRADGFGGIAFFIKVNLQGITGLHNYSHTPESVRIVTNYIFE
ncbi:hypothetical protein WA026_016727 [Henosepilachna vigintioctopunctata]|uniref:TLDc domain-containing protein n=1 Tax=Henosepilachna vigintioctopunctata TaxID=420089 RepID=A0AAW1UTF8_9CUCU